MGDFDKIAVENGSMPIEHVESIMTDDEVQYKEEKRESFASVDSKITIVADCVWLLCIKNPLQSQL